MFSHLDTGLAMADDCMVLEHQRLFFFEFFLSVQDPCQGFSLRECRKDWVAKQPQEGCACQVTSP